jgi:hypothetical protein
MALSELVGIVLEARGEMEQLWKDLAVAAEVEAGNASSSVKTKTLAEMRDRAKAILDKLTRSSRGA